MKSTVAELFAANVDALQLSWVTGHAGAARLIGRDLSKSADSGGDAGKTDDNSSVDAADLVGHLNSIHPGRLQVLGREETAYIGRIDATRFDHMMADMTRGNPPAFIVADGVAVPEPLLNACRRQQLPLLSTPIHSARVIDSLRSYLVKLQSQQQSMHGVFMDVLGMGVLISGESGLGKSELGLELISRGHGLVADDIVDFTRIGPQSIEGRCPPLLQNLLEVRGLGLLDIKTIFGETAVRRRMRLKLIVHLVRRSTMENQYERLPLEAQTEEVLGVPIRQVTIPVAAGRNIAVLTEAAVRNTILQLRGIDSTQAFLQRQRQHMTQPGSIDPGPVQD
jgi:HPr kinase/phosphorylase